MNLEKVLDDVYYENQKSIEPIDRIHEATYKYAKYLLNLWPQETRNLIQKIYIPAPKKYFTFFMLELPPEPLTIRFDWLCTQEIDGKDICGAIGYFEVTNKNTIECARFPIDKSNIWDFSDGKFTCPLYAPKH